MTGRVIVLNGPSSSGKTSVGAAMLPLLDDPWFLVPVDAVSRMRSTTPRRPVAESDLADVLRRTRLGYHRVVGALASVGNDVIMDYPLSEAWRVADLVDVLDGHDVTLVHVRADLDELERREVRRGDRPLGLASSQDVFAHGDCDIEVYTTGRTPESVAAEIVRRWPQVRSPKAFERLRAR